ncbi:MAG: hypothetical protein AAF558_10225 [Verrucomicrobiota bacterium]
MKYTPQVWFFIGIILGTLSISSSAQDLRDPDALYFDGLAGKTLIILEVKKATAVYATRTRNAYLRNFSVGDKVELVAYHPETFLVRESKSSFEGWVPAENLTPPDPEKIEEIQALLEEEKKYSAAIKEKKVISGMIPEHVRKVLGKPDETAFRTDENGRSDVWTYIEYDSVYQNRDYRDPTTGQVFYRRVRVKVPVSEKVVEFTNGRVTAIEKVRIR